jgi:hypothetical protein
MTTDDPVTISCFYPYIPECSKLVADWFGWRTRPFLKFVCFANAQNFSLRISTCPFNTCGTRTSLINDVVPVWLFAGHRGSEQKEGMQERWKLSDAQWALIEPILRPKQRADGRGRPWRDTRTVLCGVLWVLGTGAQWRELQEAFIDATFASAKKGALQSDPLAGARERKSSLSPLITVFLSPLECKALPRVKASSLKRCLGEAS